MDAKPCLCLGFLLAFGCSANAGVVYSTIDSTFPNGAGGGWVVGMFLIGGNLGVAIPFVPLTTTTLSSISVPLTISSSAPYDQLTIQIASGATSPGTVLESFPVTFTGYQFVVVDSTIHPALLAGNKYWVEVMAPDITNTSALWGWGSLTIPTGEVATYNDFGSGPFWNVQQGLIPGVEVDDVPEPATGFVFFGLISIGALVLRQNRVNTT
jgi:hypothetical protein